MKKIILCTIATFFIIKMQLFAQVGIYSDPAQSYLRLYLERNPATQTIVGPYKVIGTPYLFGEDRIAVVYFKNANSETKKISYNTYTQDLEVTTEQAKGSYHVKEIDSFYLEPIPIGDNKVTKALLFINGRNIFSNDKFFYQKILDGNRYSLYKRYFSDLDYVSTNYVQSELRQFKLNYDFFYTDTATKKLINLKLTNAAVIKEFKKTKNVTAIIGDEQIISNPEAILTKVMLYLNE